MLEIMLCGASDTASVREEFAEVVGELGGEPWHFLDGSILFLNTTDASWVRNSRASVRRADLCVFVIVGRYGEITWGTELVEALTAGKPFLILCLDETYGRYLELRERDAVTPPAPEEAALFDLIREIEADRQLTVVQFSPGQFGRVLRHQLARLFSQALGQLESRNRRYAVQQLLSDADRALSTRERELLREIALDEVEDKRARKAALRTLTRVGGLSPDDVLELLRSLEQGVQRQTAADLALLYRQRPADPAFLDDVVEIANDSDDVGFPRRLVGTLLDLDAATGLAALAELDLEDVGLRRRIAAELEHREDALRSTGLGPRARALAQTCVDRSDQKTWVQRCRAFITRLGDAE